MSLSSHFKKSIVPPDNSDLSWLSPPFTPVGLPIDIPPESKTPREPNDLLPSRGTSTYMKNVRFTAYKSTRPVLLQEVTSIVENGLRELAAKYTENIPNEFIVDVYSAAFDRYIEESTLYKPFLSSVKQCYDSTIAECTRRTLQYDELDIMLKKRDDVHFSKMQAAEEEFTAKLRVSEAKINVLQATAKESTTNTAKLVLENSKLHESNLMLKKELEASKNTSGLLSAQLARLAEDKLKSDSVESARLLELSQLKQQEMTLNNELERLREVVAEKDAVHATLVAPEVLAAAHARLAQTQSENERICRTHRQLLMRYTAVKFMIDGSFRRIDEAKQLELEEPHIGRAKTQSKVLEVLHDYNTAMLSIRKKEALRLKAPTEKVLELVRESTYPVVIFECLLDQIETLQGEKRRLLYGDEADAGGLLLLGEDGAVINEDGDVDEVLPADAVFEGLGFGEEVPSYLRYEGTIRNIRISRRTTIDLVHEICAAKAAHEALGVNAVSVVLPAARRQNSSTVNGRDSDSDLESVDTRPRSSMLRSPPLSPVSPRTQALFGSMRPFSGGGAEEPGGAAAGAVLSVQADAGGALPALSSIDSRAELSVMSLSTLPSTCSMAEFFECFLRDKVHDSSAAVELAYNIVDALKRHSARHSDCELFMSILAGEVQLAVWVDRNAVLEKLRNSTSTRAAEGEWKLTPERFMKVVKKVLNTASEEDIEALREVVMTEQSSDSRYVSGNALIFDGEDGAPSPFLELVRAQHLQDCLAVEKTVLECIQQVCGELLESHTGCPPGEVPVSKLRAAMQLADPKKSRLEVNLLLARGAGCSLEALLLKEAKRVPVALEEFKANVVRGLLKKSPQAPAKKAK